MINIPLLLVLDISNQVKKKLEPWDKKTSKPIVGFKKM